jgi:hypothetical protein
VYDSIINKTQLSYRTNRIIGGVAPSEYLASLEAGTDTRPAVSHDNLDRFLRSHLINPELLREDDFQAFMDDRQKKLLALIEQATGKAVYSGAAAEEGEDVESDDALVDSNLNVAAA